MIPEESLYKYGLPDSMASYANEHFELYIKERDLQNAILQENPVPENLDPVKKLDDFARGILKKKCNQVDLDLGCVFEKIQTKTRNVMGPLSRLWTMVEEAGRSKEDQVPISLDLIKEHIEQTILLLGQASNSISYQRRYSILLGIVGSPPKIKEMLREEAVLLQKHDTELFGKKFREHITETSKAKKQTLEVFGGQQKKQMPFRGGPSQPLRRNGGGQQRQQQFFFNKSRGGFD